MSGVPDERVVIAEDGVVVDLVDGQASVTGAVPSGYVYVDGLAVGDVSESLLKDRRILGDGGFISVIMVVDSVTGKVVGRPGDPRSRQGHRGRRVRRGAPQDRGALDRAAADGIADPHQLSQIVRRIVGRWVSDNYRRRPMIVPVVIEA